MLPIFNQKYALAKFLNRFDQVGLRRYSKSAGWMLGARILNTIIGFLVGIYVIRSIGPENYGQLSYAVSFVGFFAIIASLGIDAVLQRELVDRPGDRDTYLGSALVIKLVMGTVATVSTSLAGYFFVADDVSKLVIYILAPTFIFTSFHIILHEFLIRVQQKYTSLVLIAVTLTLNILKIIIIATGGGILYLAGILLIESILYAICYISLRIYHYGSLKKWKFQSAIARKLIIDSWPFIFIAVFTTIYSRIDQVMLKHIIGAEAVGLYDAAVRIAETWLIVPAVIASSLFPAIINARISNISEYHKRLTFLALGAGLTTGLVALILSLAAPFLIVFLYGVAFTASTAVFIIYVWGTVFAAIEIVTRLYLIAENKKFTIFSLTAGSAILNIVLNLLLIPPYGIIGAAWATFFSYMLLTIPLFSFIRFRSNRA